MSHDLDEHGPDLLLLVGDWAVWRVGQGFGIWNERTQSDEDGPVFFTSSWLEAQRYAIEACPDRWSPWCWLSVGPLRPAEQTDGPKRSDDQGDIER